MPGAACPEALLPRFADVDIDGNVLQMRTAKGDKARQIASAQPLRLRVANCHAQIVEHTDAEWPPGTARAVLIVRNLNKHSSIPPQRSSPYRQWMAVPLDPAEPGCTHASLLPAYSSLPLLPLAGGAPLQDHQLTQLRVTPTYHIMT